MPWIHCIECIFFIILDFWATCACPENQRVPWNFSLYWIYFLLFRIFEQHPLVLKTEFALEFFTVLNILFTFRLFEQLTLALKNRGCPEFTVLNVYFLLFWILEQLALALKNRGCLGILHSIEIYFIIQEFWATCACPENRVFPEIFQSRGGGPPLSPASYTYGNSNHIFNDRSKHNPLSGYKAHYLYRFEVFIFQEMQNSVLILCARASQTFFFCVPILKKLFVYAPPLMDSLD